MNIFYVSCLCSLPIFNTFFSNSTKMPGQQVQKYHRMIAEGLASHDNVTVNTISNYPVSRSNCNAYYLRSNADNVGGVQYGYIAGCNLPVLRNLWNLLQSFARVWNKKNNKQQTVVICDILNISISMGALLAAKLRGIPTIGIVTDIPIFLSQGHNSFAVKINTALMNAFDSYVLLTEAMTEVVKCAGKPYTVIEGQVDIEMKSVPNYLEDKYEKKVCIYAGGLQKIYGIPYLVQAFLKVNVPNTELHIYGSGDYQDELAVLCQQHPSIRYFGVRSNAEVVAAEVKATLLINPRPTIEAYTKYSFPSKNMEYMVSGTPVLTTKLPGMPEEYYPYVYWIEDETVEGLAKALNTVLGQSKGNLHEFGLEAKKFVLKEKNNIIQAEKIIRMMNESKKGNIVNEK